MLCSYQVPQHLSMHEHFPAVEQHGFALLDFFPGEIQSRISMIYVRSIHWISRALAEANRNPMRRVLIAVNVLLLLFASAPVHAWAGLGHQLVGELAQRKLTPEASARVAELLRDEPVPTLAGVAAWADTLRASDPERFKATSRWHYVNMPVGSCDFVSPRDCPEGACVVEAIETQRGLLKDLAQPFEVRRDALKFIVHFVGDVHQPLHASNRPDRGGNDFQISLRTEIPPEEYARERYKDGIMGTNLHAVWDYYVLSSARREFGTYANLLSASSHSPATYQSGSTAWAEESCGLIDQRKLYPHSRKMGAEYLVAMRPLAEQRVVQAADRLAGLLNEALSSPGPRTNAALRRRAPSPGGKL